MMSNYAIKEIGRLGLGYITQCDGIYTVEGGKPKLKTHLCGLEDGLEIYLWAEDFSCRWVIASFDLNKHENCFELTECGDRLCNPDINWGDLQKLVILGHDMLMRVEEELE